MRNNPVVGIYLAAGRSSRMGKNKLQLPVGKSCLGSLGFKAALKSKLDFIIAVTRKEDPLYWLEPFNSSKGWSMLQCHQADQGQSASLKAGLRAAISLKASAVVVILGDQPLITAGHINQLVVHRHSGFAASLINGVITPPILFSQKFFQELSHLKGDAGARKLLREKWREQGMFIKADSNLLIDVDTEKDYQNLLRNGGGRGFECYREKCHSKGSLR